MKRKRRPHTRPNRKPLDPDVRFEKWVREGKLQKRADGCWLWLGATMSNGYGQVAMSMGSGNTKRHFSIHRWVYEFLVGPIPEGLDLDHLCRVRNCANPEHLEPVTRSENLFRAYDDACTRGHVRTPENTYVNPRTGTRTCRTCQRAWRRRQRYIAREAS